MRRLIGLFALDLLIFELRFAILIPEMKFGALTCALSNVVRNNESNDPV